MGPSGVIIRHDAFKSCGGFSGKRMIGDLELWLKISSLFPVVIVPASLIFWRQHEGQEFFKGVQSGVYLRMNLPMVGEALNSPHSTLTASEKSRIIEYNRKQAARILLINSVKRGNIKEVFSLSKMLQLSYKHFFKAVFFGSAKLL